MTGDVDLARGVIRRRGSIVNSARNSVHPQNLIDGNIESQVKEVDGGLKWLTVAERNIGRGFGKRISLSVDEFQPVIGRYFRIEWDSDRQPGTRVEVHAYREHARYAAALLQGQRRARRWPPKFPT